MFVIPRAWRRSQQAAHHLSAVVCVAVAGGLAFTRRLCDAQFTTYPYIGCYKDTRSRALPTQVFPTQPFTLEDCAALCLMDQPDGEEWKFAGIEYGVECFCGDRFDTHGPSSDCVLTLEAEPRVAAGGSWAISVYDLQEAVALNAAVGSEDDADSGSEPEDIGGDTPVGDSASDTVVASGQRAFTVINNCSNKIRVGSTGGRITFPDGDDYSKTSCDEFGPAAVYNEGPLGQGCYWDFPEEDNGNIKRDLEPGEQARFTLHPTNVDTRWSGTIWASTGCERVDGCATGVCYSPSTDYICPAYVGPGGPTTKAEFTLSDGGKDYYDVSLIDGINLPMSIEPENPVYPDEVTTNHHKYQCGSPGKSVSPTGLGGCEWSLGYRVEGFTQDLRQFVRMVFPADYENPLYCEEDDECPGSNEVCGVHPQRWADGSYKGGVEQGSCGEHIAWVSAGGACAGGWTTGEFPDAFPFYCGTSVTNGHVANMYGCNSGPLAQSGYTPGANNDVCGCPDWEGWDVNAPPISLCQGVNTEWVEWAQPWAHYLKKACPTAYTFPYDDQTSTFDCSDQDGSDEDAANTQSYTITFCPGDSESNMFP